MTAAEVRALLERADWPALEDGYEQLPEHQQRVLDLRFGLRPDTQPMTWNDVASALGGDARTVAGIGGQAIARLGRFLT